MSDNFINKRGFNAQEAMTYLGIKRKAFDKHFRPYLKPLPLGTSLIFDRLDLDRVWEDYKHGNERLIRKGEVIWAETLAYTKTKKVDGVSTKSTKVQDFENALKLLKMRKTG